MARAATSLLTERRRSSRSRRLIRPFVSAQADTHPIDGAGHGVAVRRNKGPEFEHDAGAILKRPGGSSAASSSSCGQAPYGNACREHRCKCSEWRGKAGGDSTILALRTELVRARSKFPDNAKLGKPSVLQSNVQNLHETAPSLIGDVVSNLANVRLRYQLTPYLYTLAHRAWRGGEAVFAPLVYFYQDDPNVRAMGSQKMIGPDLMMATLTGYATTTTRIYLPAGGWYNFYTNDYFESAGEWIDTPVRYDGVLRAPLFVRAGAILPTMPVDGETLNALGLRTDGSVSQDLIVTAYAGADGTFTLIEDDGETMAYLDGAVRETVFTFVGGVVTVGEARGQFAGMMEDRAMEVRVVGGE